MGAAATTPAVEATSRREVPRLVPLAVLLVLVGVSLVTFVVTRRVIDDQEHRLLVERRAEVAALVNSSIGGTQASLRVLADVGSSSEPEDTSQFVRNATPLVTGATVTIATAVADAAGRFTFVSAVGPSAPIGETLTGTRATLAARALSEGQLVAAQFEENSVDRLLVAVPALGETRAVALQESMISKAPIKPTPGSPFGGMRVVLYSSADADPAHVVLTTEPEGRTITGGDQEVLAIGAEHWLLVVGVRSPLVGDFARTVPWFLLGGGLIAAALAAVVAETLSRRRAYTEALVDKRTAELTSTRTFLERLLNAGPVVVARTTGPNEGLSYISPNVERIFGYTAAQALTPNFIAEQIHEDDRGLLRARMQDVANSDASQESSEVRFRRSDGEYRWFEVSLVAESADPLTPRAIVIYALDIDDRRHLEQAQREARDIAEAANRSKSEFLSRMSHELRTPLNAVIGFAQLLDMDDISEEQHDGVRQIIRGGKHLLDLINEVLDIARIETGRLSVSLEAVRLDDVVNDAIDLVRPLANARSIRLPDHGGADCVCHVRGDRQRLKQVLLNLLGNAVKYNRDRGRVDLSCRRMPNGRMRISVTDTGPGIAPDKLALVFMPFERLDADKTTIEGTGLGLALARGLVDAMGGDLGVDSVLGEGTTFWVELDCVSSPVESIDEAPHHPHARDHKHTRTVLYIEDNLSNVRLVERILAHRSHIRAIVAMHGDLGVELARQHQPDLVLLDLNLPDIKGEQVLARLKADQATRDIPVVIVSADATNGQIERLHASGADDYLTKPLDIEQFLRVIDRHVGAEGFLPATTPVRLPRADRKGARLDSDILRGLDKLLGTSTGLEELTTTFKKESSAGLTSLRAAIAASDLQATHELAQSLKGIAGTFGDMSTIGICIALQERAAASDLDTLAELVDDLALSLHCAYGELDDHLREADAPLP